MKLTQDNIQFIDTYLENSDVKYIDIRLEMVDHVATAIEDEMTAGDKRDFYYVFKDYMVANKRRLLDNNDVFLKQTTKKLSSQIGHKFLSVPFLVLAVLLAALMYFGLQEFQLKTSKFVAYFITGILIFIPAVFYFTALKYFKYQRFSGAERLGVFIFALVQILNVINIFNIDLLKGKTRLVLFSLFIGLLFTYVFAFIKISISVFKDYKNRYQTIA